MMTIINICICVIFLIILAFWTGKKVGNAKIFQFESRMKEYENKFNTLQNGFDTIVDSYIKELEKRIEEIKELLEDADKRCLYANDLLTGIDESIKTLKRKNQQNIDENEEAILKLKNEFKNTINELYDKIEKIHGKVKERQYTPDLTENDIKLLIQKEVDNRYNEMLEKNLIKEQEQETQLQDDLNNEIKSSDFNELELVSITVEDKKPENKKQPFNDLGTASILPSDKAYKTVDKERTKAIIERIAKKDISYLRPEVLRLYSEGITIPQIAKQMKMGIGEVQMIINLYGNAMTK